MKLNNDLANKLIEKAKSEKLSLSLICFAFILWGCIEIADEWFVHFGTLLMADCCSVSVLCGYKIRCKKLKEQKYKNYRYKKILWNLILLRTLIFVPFVYWFLSQGCWLLFKISVFNFNRLEHSIFLLSPGSYGARYSGVGENSIKRLEKTAPTNHQHRFIM